MRLTHSLWGVWGESHAWIMLMNIKIPKAIISPFESSKEFIASVQMFVTQKPSAWLPRIKTPLAVASLIGKVISLENPNDTFRVPKLHPQKAYAIVTIHFSSVFKLK